MMKKSEMNVYKSRLLAMRARLRGDVTAMAEAALSKTRSESSGDLSSMPIHMADIGTDNYEQEFSLNLLDSERKILREIDLALLRMEDESYGICEVTGRGISKARLEARPWARYCIEYAKFVEKGIVKEGEPIPD